MLNSAFSDLNYQVEEMIAERDKACWRWVLRARHTGVFQGVPATGKSVVISGMSIVRLAEGQLVEHWGEQDLLGLMQQLGPMPAPGQ
jgi:predicted ester cyclase